MQPLEDNELIYHAIQMQLKILVLKRAYFRMEQLLLDVEQISFLRYFSRIS
jgi:hypothetical protein